MMYHQIPIPPRSEHLWRYTPWHRIHPSKPDVIPSADGIVFKTQDNVSLIETSSREPTSSEIARTFLHECEGSSYNISLDNITEPIHINARLDSALDY